MTEQELYDYLHEYFDIDKDGDFRLKKKRHPHNDRVKIGDKVGCVNNIGYRVINIRYKVHYAHRLVWLYHNAEFPRYELDHKNGIRHDNRIENIRKLTHQENMFNRSFTNSKGTSKHLGVSWCKEREKWVSNINVNGKSIFLGRFETEPEAAAAYKGAKKLLHQGFGRP